MKNSFYISYAIWISLLPFLGIPGTWKSFLISGSGIFLLVISIAPIVLKRLQVKGRRRKSVKTEAPTEVPASESRPQIEPVLEEEKNNTNESQ